MTILDMDSEVSHLRAEEERILASFTLRLIEIASVAGAPGSGTSPTAALNAMRLPAIAIDQHGFVADVNTTADAVFDRRFNSEVQQRCIDDMAEHRGWGKGRWQGRKSPAAMRA